LVTPDQFRSLVSDIHEIFRSSSIPTLKRRGGINHSQIEIAENLAAWALSPSFMQELWSEEPPIKKRQLRRRLAKSIHNPLIRFQCILNWMRTLNDQQKQCWSEAFNKGMPSGNIKGLDVNGPVIKSWLGVKPLTWFPVEEVSTQSMVRLMAAIGNSVGLSTLNEMEKVIGEKWDLIQSCRFDLRLNEYFQVTLDQSERIDRTAGTSISDETPAELSTCDCLVVSMTKPEFKKPSGLKLSSTAYVTARIDRGLFQWIVSLPNFRRFLHCNGSQIALIAISNGYDFLSGDYGDTQLLMNLPHAVMVTMSLRELLERIADQMRQRHTSRISLFACLLPSSLLGKRYGYLVFKRHDTAQHVIVLPIIKSLLAAAPAITEAFKATAPFIDIVYAEVTDGESWLGPCKASVLAAIGNFESRPEPPEGYRPVDTKTLNAWLFDADIAHRDYSDDSIRNIIAFWGAVSRGEIDNAAVQVLQYPINRLFTLGLSDAIQLILRENSRDSTEWLHRLRQFLREMPKKTGEHEWLIAWIETELGVSIRPAFYFNYRGCMLAERKDYSAALVHFKDVVGRDDDFAPAHCNIVLVNLGLRRIDAACHALKVVECKFPHYAKTARMVTLMRKICAGSVSANESEVYDCPSESVYKSRRLTASYDFRETVFRSGNLIKDSAPG
jgi:hypothetical protein